MKPLVLPFSLFLLLSTVAMGQEEKAVDNPQETSGQIEPGLHAQIMQAINRGNVDEFLKLTEGTTNKVYAGFRADVLMRRGQQRFFDADIKGSLADFDEVIALDPDRDPYLWQRGITLYYADKFQEGKEQFERHQNVNDQDVENAVWHFLCAVRTPNGSVESARKNLIPITEDTRVPMKEVHDLFAGTGSAETVLAAAAKEGNPEKSDKAKNSYLYAHLYLGIYYEATGNTDLMKEHIAKAAGPYKMDHYMGKVAQVHAKLRGL
ncbi:MAG: hypothetical protein P1V20_26815 [Verrucomicrobiales bacterium]|nr:hypothetical protein [Verrucomicrobiales bacterium]